jgi:4-amino-4-deoxy-L-arabinose transferase-like glycosyltransferase
MALLGSNGFGWRFSSLYLSALSILFLYGFLKTFIARRLALTACLLLAFSHYIISFGKIGYNNLQALFGLSLVLWASARAYRMKSTFAYALLGLVTGFCFYLYPAALYAVPIPFLFLLFYDPPTSRKAIGRWILVVACALLLIFPLFLQPEYWQSKIQGTFLYSSELTHSLEKLIHHFYLTYVFAFFSYLFTPEEGHFIAVSYADPLSGVFISIGILTLLRSWRKQRFAAFWVLSFLAMVFFAGASHDRQFPPSTRMFLVLPWFALFAACGLWWMITQIQKLSGIGSLSTWVLPVVFPVILGLSLYQAYPLARDRMTGFQSLETLFFRTLQRAQTVYPDSAQTFVFITDPTWSSTPIHKLPEYYPLRAKFGEVVVEGQTIPETAYPLLTQPDAFIIIKPWFEEEWKAALEEGLRGLGKVPCDILTTNGYPRFQLWHTPGMDGLCE